MHSNKLYRRKLKLNTFQFNRCFKKQIEEQRVYLQLCVKKVVQFKQRMWCIEITKDMGAPILEKKTRFPDQFLSQQLK